MVKYLRTLVGEIDANLDFSVPFLCYLLLSVIDDSNNFFLHFAYILRECDRL